MNTRHELWSEEADIRPGRVVIRFCCACNPGRLFTAAASTPGRARRRCWRAIRDHRGFAYAAGPGGGGPS